MLLSLNPATAADPTLHALRSLVARGRHAEADLMAHNQSRRIPILERRSFLALRAEIALGLGRFAKALEWASEALKSLDPTDSVARLAECSLIRALLGLGRFREAGVVVARFAAHNADGVDSGIFRAHLALHSGQHVESREIATSTCDKAASGRQRPKMVEALLLSARAARETGDGVGARRDLDRAHRLCDGLRDTSVLASVLSERADFMAHSGNWAEAARNAGQSGRLFARTSSPHEHLSAGRRTGLLGLAQGDPRAALPSIERAADVARRGFGTAGCRAEIDLLLADAQLAGKDPEGALERATAALSFFRNSQDQGGLARAHVRRSLAALSASNMTLAFREARIASAIEGAGPVAEGLADLALGRALLRKDRLCASVPFDRASRNGSLYSPLRSVAELGVALSRGASPESDAVKRNIESIEKFGDIRILAIVRSDLREMFGIEPASLESLNGDVATGASHDDDAEFLPGLIGASEPVRRLSVTVRKAAPCSMPISIYGETGTGKEKIARAIHDLSPRASRKFVAINAASLSDELFESEIFGHVRGSFTGAQMDRPGLVEEAKGGTLFIDEVADLSPRSQIRLLRFLQDGTYRRVGDNAERRADVRIVVAANQKLEDLVSAGRFRDDLMYRVQGLRIEVPPLRDRANDIVLLARHFVSKASSNTVRLSPSALTEVRAYHWPGNIRELEQEMRRAVVLSDSPIIEWKRPIAPTKPGTPSAPRATAATHESTSLHEAVGGFERTFLKSVLSRCGEKAEAARLLGISRQALHQKILRHGL